MHSSTSDCQNLLGRRLVVRGGTYKVSTNKPHGCSSSGALATGSPTEKKKKGPNNSCWSLSRKDTEIWIVGCAFDHCLRIVAAPNCYVMPVTLRGQVGSGFVTKYSLGCKHYVRCLQILKQRHSRMHSELFHIGCYTLQRLVFVYFKSQTNLRNFWHCRCYHAQLPGVVLLLFFGLGANKISSNCMHRGFTGWSFTGVFPHSQSNKPL